MSMIYCKEHDRHVDTDWGPCDECVTSLTNEVDNLHERITDLDFAMYVAGCSDDRYHSNGRYAAHKLQLDALRRQHADLKAQLDCL